MKIPPHGSPTARVFLVLAILFAAQACDAGGESRTSDDIAADSALAADLALANRDTLLVDSIGAYQPADTERGSTSGDTASIDADPGRSGDAAPPAVLRTPPVSPRAPAPSRSTPPAAIPTNPNPVAVEPRATTPARSEPARRPAATNRSTPAAAPASPATPAARRAAGGVCNSPTLADQQSCVRATLASTDMRLNRIYRALITEMRSREGVSNGGKDPPSVQRLRVSQRAWLVYRDTECRKRGRGQEGRLWARPRVQCLGQFSIRRAQELADNFSRLTSN